MIRRVRPDGRIDSGGVFTPIYRPRVVDRLTTAAASRIVLIVAPAGYGKSTALRQYLDGISDRVIRYDLHPDNDSLLGFVRGFADAVSEIAPDTRRTVSTAFESARDSSTAGIELAMWMHAHIKSYSGTIAIDDLHIAENERQVSAFIASLVERTKERVRWIIASRSFLDLPVGSWLAYQEMDLAIDESDLAFTTEEARSTAHAARVSVRDEELESLVSLTSGWPTALSFALRSSTRSLDLRNVQAVTREMVYRYLAEQVYQGLDDTTRDLLSTCALLPTIEIDVLESLGYDDAIGMIETLRSRVAFIAPDAERPRLYRMHDLFRDFIIYRLELAGAEVLATRRNTVARQMERRGSYTAALSLYCAAGAIDDLARLIDSEGLRLFEEGRADAILPAIELLRIERTQQSAIVLALRAMITAATGQREEGESLMARAISKTLDPTDRAQLELRLARMILNRGGSPLELIEGVEQNADAKPDTRTEASAFLGVLLARLNRYDDATSAMERARLGAETTDDQHTRARILQKIGLAAAEIGQPDLALSTMRLTTELATREGLMSLASKCYAQQASMMIVYFDDRAQHLWFAQQAHVTASKGGDKTDMQTSTLHLMAAEARRGNAERVIALEQLLTDLRMSDTYRKKYAASSRALRKSWEGNFAEAYSLLCDLWHAVPEVFNQLPAGSECAVYAAADGRGAESASIVSRLLTILDSHETDPMVSPGARASALALCAFAESLSGRHTSAQKILKRVGRSIDPAIDCLREVVVHAMRALKDRVSNPAEISEDVALLRGLGIGSSALLIQAALSKVLATNTSADTPLTRSELAIIRSLALGLSPKDIAADTGRSVFTVQSHIQNAFEKLGCHGRHEAVAAALRLGLIERPDPQRGAAET